MAATGTPTPNIGLRIPKGTDPASVDDINYNSNLLDTKLGAVGNTSVQDQIDSLNSKIVNLSTISTQSFTAIASGQSSTYATQTVNVARTGYIPISVGYTCNQTTINIFRLEFSGNNVVVGASGLNSTSTVSITVVYMKAP